MEFFRVWLLVYAFGIMISFSIHGILKSTNSQRIIVLILSVCVANIHNLTVRITSTYIKVSHLLIYQSIKRGKIWTRIQKN